MTCTKKILFYLILLFFPVLILLIIEGILRVTDDSENMRVGSEISYDNIDWYQTNRNFLKQYFPAGTPLIPEFKPVLFKKNKPEGLFRVICLGGSSMFGTPYQMNANVSGILRKQLRHLYPEKEIEVLNFGASAINSQVISQFAPQLLPYEPDLVLIYMGHNEFYGPGGIGASYLQKKMPGFYSWMKRLKLYKLLTNLLSGKPKQPQEKNLMKQVSRGSLVRLDSDDAQRVFRLFRQNLSQIIRVFRDAHISVIVSDICSNLEFSPFVSDSLADGKAVGTILRRAKEKADHQDLQAALNYLKTINEADTVNAEINYRLGKIYEALDEPQMAKMHFIKANDHDLLKFRAPFRINKIIAEVCAVNGVPLVSSYKKICVASKNGIPGFDLFWEHLHPKVEGYYLITDAFLEKIIDLELVAQRAVKFQNRLPCNMERLVIPWLDLAYGDRAIRNLTGKWPFKNLTTASGYLHLGDETLRQIVEAVHQRTMMFDEGCYKTAFRFEKIGDFKNAELTYLALLEEYPYNFYAHYKLGDFYKNRGLLNKAITHYKLSIRANTDYYYPYVDLGMVLVNSGRFDEAIRSLTAAEKLISAEDKPRVKANIQYGLSAAYANKKEYKTAKKYINQALHYFPDYQAAQAMKKQLEKY